VAGASATGPVAADKSREILRFAAKSVVFAPDGVTAVLESGLQRTLRWADLERVVVRQLPPDRPFEKLIFVDLVPRPPQTRPVRLLPSTTANWAAIPGPAGVSSKENMRRLGAWIAALEPAAVEPESAAFFVGGSAPPPLRSVKQFLEYDARYG
jgi:hypothetical protein